MRLLGAMGRDLRFIPPGGAVVEVTYRTLQGRFLLSPRPDLNEIFIGVLARAKRRYPLEVCAVVFLSNHCHMLLFVESVERLAHFMRYVGSNIAREVARRTGWRERVWGRRYQAIVVSDEETAQIGRLEYLLAHGCKEGLVRRVEDWPGVHCAKALCTGRPLRGVWMDRTQEGAAMRRGQRWERSAVVETECLAFDPLPCWRHLGAAQIRSRVREIISRIEDSPRRSTIRQVSLPRHPFDRPQALNRSPAPRFHADSREVRAKLEAAYRLFSRPFDRLRNDSVTATARRDFLLDPSRRPCRSSVLLRNLRPEGAPRRGTPRSLGRPRYGGRHPLRSSAGTSRPCCERESSGLHD